MKELDLQLTQSHSIAARSLQVVRSSVFLNTTHHYCQNITSFFLSPGRACGVDSARFLPITSNNHFKRSLSRAWFKIPLHMIGMLTLHIMSCLVTPPVNDESISGKDQHYHPFIEMQGYCSCQIALFVCKTHDPQDLSLDSIQSFLNPLHDTEVNWTACNQRSSHLITPFVPRDSTNLPSLVSI